MQLTTKGLIIKVRNIGDKDKLCTVLTEKYGIINAFARGASSMKNKNASGTGLFAYSDFEIFKKKDTYIIDEAEQIEIFFKLREDLEKLALAQYFCELVMSVGCDENSDSEILRLMLNSLYFLVNEKRPARLVKAVFEMRLMEMCGYMPDLVMCDECGAYEADEMYLHTRIGKLHCEKCGTMPGERYAILSKGALLAMRHIVYSDFSAIFSFNLKEYALECLCNASENYVIEKTQKSFNTLDFYNQIRSVTG